MRGLIFTGGERAELREFPDPVAGPGQAVVAIKASGLCGTELPRFRSESGSEIISGHEPAGVIAELGPGAPPGLAVGDRVMVHHYEGCGACEMCAIGFEQGCLHGHVTHGSTAHGANAELMLVPARSLVHLPEELSFEAGTAIACGAGTAWSGLRKMGVSGRDTVAVFGQGPVGLSATMCAKAMGARVIALDVAPDRLAFAQQVGADHIIDSRSGDPVEAIRELTGGAGVSASIDTSGNGAARNQALQCLRMFGRACYVGKGAPTEIDINTDVIWRNATIFGSWTFTKGELIEIARFMVEAEVPLEQLVTGRFPIQDAERAYREFAAGAAGKFVLTLP